MSSFENRNSHKLLARAWPWSAAAATGALLAGCFPPWNQGWLCWIALIPLTSAVVARRSPRTRFLLGYLAGFVFFAVTFWWLGSLAVLYKSALLRGIPLLLALYMGLYGAFWAWFLGRASDGFYPDGKWNHSLRNLALGALGACAWVAGEWVRERLFGGFGWNPLGVALRNDLPMIQVAEFTGTPGLSWLVVFTNLLGVIIARRIIGEIGPSFSRRIRWEFSFTMALIAAVFAFGIHQLLHRPSGDEIALRVVAVQPNIPQTEKADADAAERILAQLEKPTRLALLTKPDPQLLIWPESATGRGIFEDEQTYRFVMDIAKQGDFAFCLGTVLFDPTTREDFNGAMLLTGRGSAGQDYRKMHLVPFGEYLPLRSILGGALGGLVPGDFTPGREYSILRMTDPDVSLATLICFEDTLGDLTRHFAAHGAQALVNITNDGWFGTTPAAEQHLANAVLRAVETRRPLIRCGNTGVTCEVRPNGHVDRWIEPFQQGFAARTVSVPRNAPITFYSRHGDWLSHISIAVTLLALGRSYLSRRRSAG